MPLIIACLSQKGGVGKSTLARLIARTYAAAGWSVKIADFNTRQNTASDWVEYRDRNGVEPKILAQSYVQPTALKRETVDLVVADGRPDSDQTSLDVARMAQLVVLPTGLSGDDLKPQLLFAHELVAKGVAKEKILFVLNKTIESELAVREARTLITDRTGYRLCQQDLSVRTGYQMAQNNGRAVSETDYASLNDKADALAAEIVDRVTELEGATA